LQFIQNRGVVKIIEEAKNKDISKIHISMTELWSVLNYLIQIVYSISVNLIVSLSNFINVYDKPLYEKYIPVEGGPPVFGAAILTYLTELRESIGLSAAFVSERSYKEPSSLHCCLTLVENESLMQTNITHLADSNADNAYSLIQKQILKICVYHQTLISYRDIYLSHYYLNIYLSHYYPNNY